MKRHLRVLFVSLLVAVALLIGSVLVLFRVQHLAFYSPSQAQAKFGISRSDLALVRPGHSPYVWVLPKGGYILNGLRQSRILIGLVYLPAFVIVLYEIRRLAKHRRYEIPQITRGQSL